MYSALRNKRKLDILELALWSICTLSQIRFEIIGEVFVGRVLNICMVSAYDVLHVFIAYVRKVVSVGIVWFGQHSKFSTFRKFNPSYLQLSSNSTLRKFNFPQIQHSAVRAPALRTFM